MFKTYEEGLFEEYKTLRDETLKRAELSYTILNLAFIAVGGMWVVAITSKDYRFFLFYPLLSLLFAFGYVGNAVVSADVGHYIREVLENDVYELRWAEYFRTKGFVSWIIGNSFIGGIFFGGSIFSLILYFIFEERTPIVYVTSINWLLTLGVTSTILTLAVVIFGACYKSSDRGIAGKMSKINQRKAAKPLTKKDSIETKQ